MMPFVVLVSVREVAEGISRWAANRVQKEKSLDSKFGNWNELRNIITSRSAHISCDTHIVYVNLDPMNHSPGQAR